MERLLTFNLRVILNYKIVDSNVSYNLLGSHLISVPHDQNIPTQDFVLFIRGEGCEHWRGEGVWCVNQLQGILQGCCKISSHRIATMILWAVTIISIFIARKWDLERLDNLPTSQSHAGYSLSSWLDTWTSLSRNLVQSMDLHSIYTWLTAKILGIILKCESYHVIFLLRTWQRLPNASTKPYHHSQDAGGPAISFLSDHIFLHLHPTMLLHSNNTDLLPMIQTHSLLQFPFYFFNISAKYSNCFFLLKIDQYQKVSYLFVFILYMLHSNISSMRTETLSLRIVSSTELKITLHWEFSYFRLFVYVFPLLEYFIFAWLIVTPLPSQFLLISVIMDGWWFYDLHVALPLDIKNYKKGAMSVLFHEESAEPISETLSCSRCSIKWYK